MRYTIVINQLQCQKYNLNLNQGGLMDLLSELPSWATERIINGKTYWHISRNKVIDEIPLFYQKPDTVYRAFKHLAKENMIEYLQQNRMDFVRLTLKGKGWNKLGNKSELGNESEQLGNESEFNVLRNPADKQPLNTVFSDSFPTYNIHNNTSNKREEKALDFLEKNYPSKYEKFMMENRTRLGSDFSRWCDDFNLKVVIEKLDWDVNILIARAQLLANNWINNRGVFNGTANTAAAPQPAYMKKTLK